eukprot:gene3418-3883_t
MAGKLRYLDFLEEEQERMITMKASSISLLFQSPSAVQPEQKAAVDGEVATTQQIHLDNYLINLIDSPGHVDFSSEVSTAVRVTDGALVLVDVLEGVCIQTHAVLRQAYQEKVKPCLVINKIDRLITELHMTPLEAYQHIKKVIEQVNAITGTLSSEEIILKEIIADEQSGSNSEETVESTEDLSEIGSEYHFSPDKGNVAFTTAFDGWGFTIKQFVDLCHKKTGIKKNILERTLWGDYYYHPKEKKIYKSQKGNLNPMFVTFILNSIWEVHKCVAEEEIDREKVDKIIAMLGLKVNNRDLASKDAKILLTAMLQAWLPLSEAVLSMVAEKLPDPFEGQARRMDKILKPTQSKNGVSEELKDKQQKILKDTMDCNSSDDAEIVAYVAKVFISGEKGVSAPVHRAVPPRRVQPSSIPLSQRMSQAAISDGSVQPSPTPAPRPVPLQMAQPRPAEEKDNGDFVAVVRVFSGTLRKGKKIYIMGPRFDPLNPTHDVTEIEITHLYLLMGRSLEPVDKVPAGNVCGIGGGIGDLVQKSATISTSLMCPPIAAMMFVSSPIVKVAIEPVNLAELPKLIHGLKMLNQADPLVEVYVQESGEHVIVASGELHLERCLNDLKETFAKIEVNVSAPIVPFRETITTDPTKSPIANEVITTSTANRMVRVHIKAVPLPKNISDFLERSSNVMRDLYLGGTRKDKEMSNEKGSKREAETTEREEFQKNLTEEFTKAGGVWLSEINNIWAFGPKHIGPNILLNHIPGYTSTPQWRPALERGIQSLKKSKVVHEEKEEQEDENETNDDDDNNSEDTGSVSSGMAIKTSLLGEEKFKRILELDNSIVSGFQLATYAGPLCDEPMMGVCMVVEDIEFMDGEYSDKYGPISGQIISTVKEACRSAFQAKPQRLMEALYLCEIQVSSTALGKMYSVLSSRRAQIIKEGMKEGTPIFCIQARLPVVESFGFSENIMVKTSGSASTQLFFDNFWATMEQDPFFTLTTEEELEEHGSNVSSLGNNIARQYMDKIRRRKGLAVEEKLVVHAEKQRTLKR